METYLIPCLLGLEKLRRTAASSAGERWRMRHG